MVIISISSLAVEGRIGESGVNLLRRMLQDEEATIDQAEKDDTCKDKTPLPIPIGVNENLNCKKIKKENLCEEEYDGKYLYGTFVFLFVHSLAKFVRLFEHFSFISLSDLLSFPFLFSFLYSYYIIESCEKSCEICEDEYDTTEAPTGDLLDVIVFDELGEPVFDPSAIEVDEEGNVMLVVEESAAPTLSPIAPFTDAPTESPSAYPTTSPTVNKFADGEIFEGLDDDELLATLGGM